MGQRSDACRARLRRWTAGWAVWLALCPALAYAGGSGTVSAFVLSPSASGARATLKVPANLRYRVFTLTRPARVVLDLLNAQLADSVRPVPGDAALVRGIRWAPRFDGQGERLVFDLRQDAVPRTFLRRAGHRDELIVDLARAGALAAGVASTTPARPVMTATGAQPQHLRDVVVAIDPGHGGRDSGAIGPDGLEEKNVTLAIAKALYARLRKVPGIKPILTRTGDYYVSLAERRKIAHKAHADLFISIHADSSPYHYPKGSTVYVLSRHGASSVAARILAQSENSADRVAGVNLSDEEPVVRSTILKLSQRGTLAQSMLLARGVMNKINAVVPLHSDDVERAAFVVLKSPDIPSILVETAFISNRREEHQLATRLFRDHLADAIARGVKQYANQFAPPGTLIAARRSAIFAMKQG